MSIVKPATSVEEIVKVYNDFELMKQKLLTDQDYQIIKDKKYIKRSGFRKIATFFNLSDRIIEKVRTDRADGSFTWSFVVEARAPNGRTSIGVGICDSKERSFAHTDHDVYATSHTRAKSRAISDLVASGVVSAEEIEAENNTVEFKEISIVEALTRVGIDPKLVEIRLENGRTLIYATRGLDDWVSCKVALAVIGYVWNPSLARWEKQ